MSGAIRRRNIHGSPRTDLVFPLEGGTADSGNEIFLEKGSFISTLKPPVYEVFRKRSSYRRNLKTELSKMMWSH